MKSSFSKSITYVLLIIGSILSALNCSASTIMGEPFYSPKSKQLYNDLLEISKETNWTNLNSLIPEEMKEKYGIRKDENDLFVGAKLRINEMYDDNELWQKGLKVGTRINSIATVKIPLYAYLSLNEIDGIDYVEIDSEVKTQD